MRRQPPQVRGDAEHETKALRPARKRVLVNELIADWGVSIRRACAVLLCNRSSFQYASRRSDQAGLKERIKDICETRVRYDYRRVHVQLRREGWKINHKRTHRLYNALGLQLRNSSAQAPWFERSAERLSAG